MANINVGKNVTVIPARKRVGNTVSTENIPKLRVAAYCRVSTDTDEQATSYEAQVEHYTDFIRKNIEWNSQASLLMMVSQAQTRKNVMSLTA